VTESSKETPAEESPGVCLFIGIPLSLRSLKAVANAASDLKERSASSNFDLRWVPPARYHVTLKYLGWTRPDVVPAIRDAVAAALAGHKAFDMRCRELGAFPSLEKAEVLWAGLDDRMGELSGLAKKIGAATEELGFPKEGREFQPHVTMARLKVGRNIVKLTQDAPVRVFSKSWVDTLILYKSSVESETSEYEKIASWSLESP
jgi:2'-5' RNA ligase